MYIPLMTRCGQPAARIINGLLNAHVYRCRGGPNQWCHRGGVLSRHLHWSCLLSTPEAHGLRQVSGLAAAYLVQCMHHRLRDSALYSQVSPVLAGLHRPMPMPRHTGALNWTSKCPDAPANQGPEVWWGHPLRRDGARRSAGAWLSVPPPRSPAHIFGLRSPGCLPKLRLHSVAHHSAWGDRSSG